MTGFVEVVIRRKQVWVFAYARTVDGFWVASDLIGPLDSDLEADQLGKAVMAASRRSRTGVPTPDVDSLSRPSIVVTATGARSFAEYVKGVKSVNVEFDRHLVTITPTANRGARGGLVPLIEHALTVEHVSDVALGSAVRGRLELAV
jgi:hypothetical protein